MIIQKIHGGLGNQMFQYAYARALSLRNKEDFLLDINSFNTYILHKYSLEFFNIKRVYASRNLIPIIERLSLQNRYISYLWEVIFKPRLKRLYGKSRNSESKPYCFDEVFGRISNSYIDGYFQTEKYFLDYSDVIKRDFECIVSPSPRNKLIIDEISKIDAVSMHIRRGDYVSNKNANLIHGSIGIEYYYNAVGYISEKIKNPIFYIFSDDIEWVKNNLSIDYQTVYIDRNDANHNYEDLRIMSLCKHNIIANSSFSWRGARLNNNIDKIIIAPKMRTRSVSSDSCDIVPKNWILL